MSAICPFEEERHSINILQYQCDYQMHFRKSITQGVF